MFQGDLGITMTCQSRDHVNRRAGLEQFGCDAMPKAVDSGVGAFGSNNSEFGHSPMNARPHHIFGTVRVALGVDKQIAVGIRLVVFVGLSTGTCNTPSKAY